jgi:hypothetical protein
MRYMSFEEALEVYGDTLEDKALAMHEILIDYNGLLVKSGLSRRPVKAEITGSSPVQTASAGR